MKGELEKRISELKDSFKQEKRELKQALELEHELELELEQEPQLELELELELDT